MSELTDRTITALRADRDEVAALASGLSDADLERPSGSADWDVAQVLSHLGSSAEIGLAGLQSVLAGADYPGHDFNVVVWDRWNAMGRREQAHAFLDASERYVRAFESLDAATRDSLQVKLPFLPAPAGLEVMTGMRVMETTLHAWDVQVAFTPDAVIGAEPAGVLFDQLRGPLAFILGFLGKPSAGSGAPATLRLQLSDPDRSAVLVIGERVSWGDDDAEASVTMTGTTEAFLRLASGRLAPAHTPAGLDVSGTGLTLDDLRAMFAGY